MHKWVKEGEVGAGEFVNNGFLGLWDRAGRRILETIFYCILLQAIASSVVVF